MIRGQALYGLWPHTIFQKVPTEEPHSLDSHMAFSIHTFTGISHQYCVAGTGEPRCRPQVDSKLMAAGCKAIHLWQTENTQLISEHRSWQCGKAKSDFNFAQTHFFLFLFEAGGDTSWSRLTFIFSICARQLWNQFLPPAAPAPAGWPLWDSAVCLPWHRPECKQLPMALSEPPLPDVRASK